MHENAQNLECVTELPILGPRSAESNKGDFGKVLVIAGSRGMSGAAILTGSAVLRSGAGLARVAVPAGILQIVAGGNPCYTTIPLPEDEQGRISSEAQKELLSVVELNDVLAIGPGLGQGRDLTDFVNELIGRTKLPVVLDADGLNAYIDNPTKLGAHQGTLVITPHPGEFSRLTRRAVTEIQQDRDNRAASFAKEQNLIVVLKGHKTIVTDGQRIYRNNTGNPGMATGGSGDVLTGVIAALIGQGLNGFEAAQLGVFVHGLAGDLAVANVGEMSLIASDLLDCLPQAFMQIQTK